MLRLEGGGGRGRALRGLCAVLVCAALVVRLLLLLAHVRARLHAGQLTSLSHRAATALERRAPQQPKEKRPKSKVAHAQCGVRCGPRT
jgi:hypothetical protein